MEDSEISKKDKVVFGAGIVFSVLLMFAVGWLYYFYNFQYGKTAVKPAIPEQKPPEVIQKTETELGYKESHLEVLNASGNPGAAGKLAEKLKANGYSNVTTGNYGTTVSGNLLFAPKDIPGFSEDLRSFGFIDYKFEVSTEIKVVIGK